MSFGIYANSVWNPHRQGLIKDLEKVQTRATKLVLTFKHLTYKERLVQLTLPTLKYRRLRSDVIEVFKILTGKYDTNVTFSFEKHQDCRTRGHNLKVVNYRCHHELRKYCFCTRIINTWNSLPKSVISASTTGSFQNKLDEFWSTQDLYNYKAELTGIGSRSFINNFD